MAKRSTLRSTHGNSTLVPSRDLQAREDFLDCMSVLIAAHRQRLEKNLGQCLASLKRFMWFDSLTTPVWGGVPTELLQIFQSSLTTTVYLDLKVIRAKAC